MLIENISFMGWLHSLACMIALVAGTAVMIRAKGTRTHRRWGWWYAGAMAVQAITIMAVYRFDLMPGHKPGPNTFGMFHWMAVASFVAVALAIFAATRQRKSIVWAHVHAQSMLFSYYLLIGGLINEAIVRVTALRTLATQISPHAPNAAATLLAREAQTGWMMIWLTLALWFYLKVGRDRTPRPVTIGYPMRYSGGLFVACVGAGILLGALTGMMSYGVLGGFVLGFMVARRGRHWAAPTWGRPSLNQMRAMVLAVGSEVVVLSMLGAGNFFAHATRATVWEITLLVVALHFLIMRFSHGWLMVPLAATLLAWIGMGALLLHLPMPVLAAGDGLIKIGFGLWMGWPLLRVLKDRSAPEYRPASGPVPAAPAE